LNYQKKLIIFYGECVKVMSCGAEKLNKRIW